MIKKTIAVALLILAAACAFAVGTGEEVRADATGTVVGIIHDDSPGSDEATIVLSTDDGEFRIKLTQAIVDELGLAVGDEISISGIVEAETEHGVTTLKAKAVTIDGQRFVVEDESDDDSGDDSNHSSKGVSDDDDDSDDDSDDDE